MLRALVFIAALAFGLMISVGLPNPLSALDHGLRQFSDVSLAFIHRTLTRPKADATPIDASAAAKIDEDLDWRMAKTPERMRAYLLAHPHGAHALEAQATLDGLIPPKPEPPKPQTPKFSPLVEVENAPPKPPELGVFAALEQPPAPAPETKFIVKWREPRTRYVPVLRPERRRHAAVRRSPWPPFFAWFGPRDPRDWRGY